MRKILLLLGLIVWMGFIYWNSLQTGTESSETSGRIVSFLMRMAPEWLSEETLSLIVRKTAHVLEFAVLGGLGGETVRLWLPKARLWLTIIIAFGISLAASCVDETIQLFVPGRSGAFADILIDAAGIALGLLTWLALKNREKKKDQIFLNNRPRV